MEGERERERLQRISLSTPCFARTFWQEFLHELLQLKIIRSGLQHLFLQLSFPEFREMFSLIVAADCSSCLFGQNLGCLKGCECRGFAWKSPKWRIRGDIRGDEEGHDEHFWPLALFQFYGEDLWHKGVARCILSIKKKCKTPTPTPSKPFFIPALQGLQHFKTMKLHLIQTSPIVVEACPGRCRTSMTWKRKGWEPWHLGPKNVLSQRNEGAKVLETTQRYWDTHTYHACRNMHRHIISVFIATKISNWICTYQFSSFFKIIILDSPN